jgi:D-arabinitol dehydrogenase (NADP+)
VGEQVTVNPNVPCGRCSYCRAGRPILCEDLAAYGVTRPGFFAELAVVPADRVHSVEGLHRDTAVFAEPTACAMHGLENLSPRPGSSVLVLGSGATGLLLAQLIASGGGASVTVAGISADQLATAAALGVDATELLSPSDNDANVAQLLASSPHGDGYDYVVEATGVPSVGETTLRLVRRGGTVLVYGVNPADARLAFAPYEVFRRELTIRGSFATVTSFDAAILALRTGRARTDGIITHRFALEEYGDALAALRGGAGVHKVVVDLTTS